MRKRNFVPAEVVDRVIQIISRSLNEAKVEWSELTQRQRSDFYTQWTGNDQIRVLLGSYIDNIRGYLKDDIMRPLQQRQRETENIPERLEKLLYEKRGIEVTETVECRKTKIEYRLLWRLKGNTFLVITSGSAAAWRSLLVRTMEWNIISQKRLRGITLDQKPILVLFRTSGDTLGQMNNQYLVKQIAMRCGVDLIILPPKQKSTQKASPHPIPLFAEPENI